MTKSAPRVLLLSDDAGENPVASMLSGLDASVHVDRFHSMDEARTRMQGDAYDCIVVMLVENAASAVASLMAKNAQVIDASRQATPNAVQAPAPPARPTSPPPGTYSPSAQGSPATVAPFDPDREPHQTELEAMIAAMPDAVVVTDASGAVSFMNVAACMLFEAEENDLLGESIGFAAEPGTCALIEVRRSTGPRLAELRVAACAWRGAPGNLAIIRDVTERAEAETKLHRAQRIEAFGLLAGGIAHDFNNLLLVLGAAAEKFERMSRADDDTRQAVATMTGAIASGRDMVRNLMAFGGAESGQAQARTEIGLIDLNKAVSGVYDLLRGALPADVELSFLPSDQTLTVLAGASQLEQILVNLVINARDALDGAGRITISTSLVQAEPGAGALATGWARIRVADDGAGIPADQLPWIFEPFYSSKSSGGSGLGLPTCHAIVTQLGGRIDVASEPGAGSEFMVTLPWRGELCPQEAPAPEPMETDGPSEGVVLVVDDNVAVVASTREILEQAGYRVLVASNGVEAASVLRLNSHVVDLVLTDLVMPVAGGFEVLQYVSMNFPSIPLILMSSYHDRILAGTDALKFSGYDVLMKPYLARDLIREVRKTLGSKTASQRSLRQRGASTIN